MHEVTVDDENCHGGVLLEENPPRWAMWGEIDAAVRGRVADRVAAHLRETGDEHLTVDLGEVTFFDSGGLRLLYAAADAKPTPPVLVRVPGKIRDLLRISGVESMFVLQD
ncbi:STAS domain-containing protein [Promicromonospora sp. Marseille-Q5078]